MTTITETHVAATAKRRPRVDKSKVETGAQTTPKKFLFQLRARDNEYGAGS